MTVSVVIPAYNAASLLDRCLESVIRQTVPAQEIWVVNDGSTDETATVLTAWQARDSRIHAIHQTNQGLATARNVGIAAATSDWIAFLDHDDMWMPDKLERMLDVRKRDPEAAVLYHDAVRPDDTLYLAGKGAAEGDIFENLLRSYFILPSTTMVRRDVLIAAGMFDARRRRAEDYDLFLRLSRRWRFLLLNESLTYYEQQPTSLTRNSQAMIEAQISIFEDLLTGQLVGKLTPHQRAVASRRLARFHYESSYHLRSVHRGKSWQALLRSLQFRPGSAATWKLALANLWHECRLPSQSL